MKKRIIQGFIAALMVSVMTVTPVFATSIEDMKEDKAQVQSEVASLQSQLRNTLDKIQKLEKDLTEKEEEIEQANLDLERSIYNQNQQYESMKLRIKYMYEEGDSTLIETILSANSFSDLVNKAEYVSEVHSYDRKKLNEYIEITKKIEELQVTLQEEVTELETMQADLETEKAGLNDTLASKQSQLAQLDQEIQDAIQAQREAEQARQEANQAGQNQNNNSNSNNSSSDKNNNSGNSQTIIPPQGQDGWAVVAYARQFLGNPYVYGGNSLTNGIDCSGFTQQVYRAFGVSLPRTADSQASVGVTIPLAQAKAGDLLCYYGHVGIYNGSGGIIHASSPEVGIVEWNSCLYRDLKCVKRVL